MSAEKKPSEFINLDSSLPGANSDQLYELYGMKTRFNSKSGKLLQNLCLMVF